MRLLITGLALVCCSPFLVAHAQTASQQATPQKPTPEEMQRIMEATFGAMVPIMAKMTEATIQAQLKLAVLPETAEDIATFKKNLFDSLQKKGFTAEQAFQIILATNIPSATPSLGK